MAQPSAYQKVTSEYDVTEAGKADKWYLAFDGVDDFMVVSPGRISQPFTVVSGLRYRAISGQGDFYRSGGDAVSYTNASSGDDYAIFAGSAITSGVPADTLPHVRLDRFNTTNSTIRLDGVEIASGDVGTKPLTDNNPSTVLTIGKSSGAIPEINLSAFIVIDRILTDDEIAKTEKLVADRTAGVIL